MVGANLNIQNSQFINCRSFSHGGAMFIQNTPTIIENTKFISCSSGGNDHGGGVFFQNTQPFIDGAVFENCRSNGNGGGLYLLDLNMATISDTKFSSCSAYFGGAINHEEGLFFNLTGISTSSCSAKVQGGAVFIRTIRNMVRVSDSSFKNNYADDKGGGMYVDSYTNLMIDSTYIMNNSALRGGGLYVDRKNEVVLFNTTFSNNKADSGGAIYSFDANAIEIGGCEYSNNSADSDGGAIYLARKHNLLSITSLEEHQNFQKS